MTDHGIDIAQLVFWTLAGLLTAGSVILLIRPVLAGEAGLGPRRLASLVMWGVPALSLGLYLALGRPDLTDWRTRPVLPPFIASSVDKLTADVKQNPTDVQAWFLLGQVYVKIQHYDEGAASYRRAAELDPATPLYKALVGQALVMAAGDAVTPDALGWFDKARDEPLSRYYRALATAQSGDWGGALAEWQALEKDMPAYDERRKTIDERIADAPARAGPAKTLEEIPEP